MTSQTAVPLRQLAAVAAGNALEFYDFLIFTFFATQIGAAFFPPAFGDYGRLLASLATFGVGFLTRPLGGLVIGRLGDRIGRKPAMLLSFGLMGGAIVGLALTPSYASIGWVAPVLAVLFRLVQGFALGGEVGPSTAFLMEAAPAHRRGFYIALQNSTQFGAVLISGLVGLTLAQLLPHDELATRGWRIAFLLGAAVVPFGLWLRHRLPETFPNAASARRRYSRPELMLGLLGLVMLASNTISTYVLNYLVTYAVTVLKIAPGRAFVAAIVAGLCAMVFALIGGLLSDRLGRRPVLLASTILLMLAAVPVFVMMNQLRSLGGLMLGAAILSSLLATQGPAILAILSESLPTGLRSGGIGLVYALAIAVFGGTAQFIVTWLMHVSGTPLAPAWYMAGALALGVLAMLPIKETAPGKSNPFKTEF